MRIFAADVAYDDAATRALGALVAFDDWSADHAFWEVTHAFTSIAPYEPGAFYKRELPCWLALLALASAAGHTPDLLVVDGYARFSPDRPALGTHLHAATGTPVIGVAKTRFATADHLEIRRGTSASPLYITAIGLPVTTAAAALQSAHGAHRIPTMLRRVDALARGHAFQE